MPTSGWRVRARAFFRRVLWRFVRGLMIMAAGIGPGPPPPPPPAPPPTEQVVEDGAGEDD